MDFKNTLSFEVGDIVYCPAYDLVGPIVDITRDVNIRDDEEAKANPWFKILGPRGESDITTVKMCQSSCNSFLPSYLTMVCKKEYVVETMCRGAFLSIKGRYQKDTK